MRKLWTNNEIKFLCDNFSDMENIEISKLMGKSVSSITKKAYIMKIKKSPNHKSLMISRRNKIVGRDLTNESLCEIAKKYKSRSEFQKSDPSGYSTSLRKGILNDICGHMILQSFSIPQLILSEIIEKTITNNILYNDRKIISPYEIDVFLPDFNLGFEYNGLGWHLNNKNDNLKQKKCEIKNITLITFIENNRNYLTDIKNQYIAQLSIINKICGLNIKSDDILNLKISNPYNKIYNINDLLNITRNYMSFKEFKKIEVKTYKKLLKLKLLDDATNHMKDRRKDRNIKEITEKINAFTYLSDLIKYDWGTYQYVKKNKLNYLLSNLIRKRKLI